MTINYHKQIQAYESEHVNLPDSVRDDLYDKREANRNRLKNNLPDKAKIRSFIPQGSMAIRTTVQEEDCDYDVDDGVSFYAEGLKGDIIGIFDMSAKEVQEMVLNAISKDADKFKKPPEIIGNCVRVFYAEGYHVDIPAFRVIDADKDTEVQELAGESGWRKSDPTEINKWFEQRVQALNRLQEDAGGQFRRIIRLLKRFARSRGEKWNLPNGLKLTMLTDECFERSHERDDKAFYYLLKNIEKRLKSSLIVYNRAQPEGQQDKLTRADRDQNMVELQTKVAEAIQKLQVIENTDCTKKAARDAWEWVFQTKGFFKSLDDKEDDEGGQKNSVAPVTPSGPFIKTETRFG